MSGRKSTAKEQEPGLASQGVGIELVVLLHGYWGTLNDWQNFEKHLAANCSKPIHILKIKGNGGRKTKDGVRKGAERAFQEVCNFLDCSAGKETLTTEEETKASKAMHPIFSSISLIGHSLGGIYARYLAMLLDNGNVFSRVKPNMFITLATPHLGIRRQQAKAMVHNKAVIQGIKLYGSRTARQLALTDKSHLLHQMVGDKFLDALKKFNRRITYSNVKNDFLVYYSTAAIRSSNPYRKSSSAMLERSSTHPSITQWSLDNVFRRLDLSSFESSHSVNENEKYGATEKKTDICAAKNQRNNDPLMRESEKVVASSSFGFRFDPKKERLREMLQKLDSLGWERYDVLFHNTLLAHEQIITKKSAFRGKDVAIHCASLLSSENLNHSTPASSETASAVEFKAYPGTESQVMHQSILRSCETN